MKLSDEQKQIVVGILDSLRNKQVTVMAGLAGTGKTTVISHLIKVLKDFAVCAYTGRAASILRSKGVAATTIHKLIYVPEKDEEGKTVIDRHGNSVFVLADSLPYEGIIVDEASMVSRELYEDLLSFGVPVLFVGDHGQLEPIGEHINLMAYPDFVLETIHRNAGEIAHFANWIRQGYLPSAFARFSRGKVQFVNRWQADAYLTQVDQIICAFNKTRVQINARVRAQLGLDPSGPVEKDRVMCLKNNNRINLFNGMQGVVEKMLKKNRMFFRADDNSLFNIIFDRGQFGRESYDLEHGRDAPDPFDWCYACTCHKAQGGEWETVMVYEQKSHQWDHRRWCYTCASRAQEKLLWVPL